MFSSSSRPGSTLSSRPTPMSVWWLRPRGCHHPQANGLGEAREPKGLQGAIACLGTKLTASKHSCPSHGQPWPCPLQSGSLGWTDTCSSYSAGNRMGPGAGAGGGKRGLGVRTRPRWRRVQRDTQGGLETHGVLWAVSGGPLRFGGTGGKDWSHSDEIPLVGRTVFVGRSGAGCGVQAVERSHGRAGDGTSSLRAEGRVSTQAQRTTTAPRERSQRLRGTRGSRA